MPLFTISPNMNLPVPNVGQDPGPDYGLNINSALTLIDQHDHTPGKGVQLTPASLNINSALTFNDNPATNVAYTTYFAQGSTPPNDSVYVSGADLFYVDGIGNNVRITQNGNLAGTPGSIANLTPPASASYNSVSDTFVWESAVNTPANMDFAAAILRNLVSGSNSLTLQPPSLGSSYTITLPTLPVSQSFLTIDQSGVMAAPAVFPLTGANIANNTITDNLFAVGAQIPLNTSTISSTSSASSTDGTLLLNSGGGAFTVTLFSATSTTHTIRLKKTSNDLQAITIATTGGQTIDGMSTVTLMTQYEEYTLQSNGTNWIILDHFTSSAWINAGATVITSTGTSPTKANVVTDLVQYRRVGNCAQIKYTFSQNGSGGSAGTGMYLFQLPAGMLIDTTVQSTSTDTTTAGTNIGVTVATASSSGWWTNESTGVAGPIVARAYDSNHLSLMISSNLASNQQVWQTCAAGNHIDFNAQIALGFTVEVPIHNWTQ